MKLSTKPATTIKSVIAVAALAISTTAISAERLNVKLSGAFHAVTESLISTGERQSAFVYSVKGATTLTTNSGKQWKFSIDCLGFDEVGGHAGTSGVGRCSWADSDNDRLMIELVTEGESNRYRVTGGTGKWQGVSGSFKSNFEYLPAPSEDVFLGTDEGKGFLNLPSSVSMR
ncbi:hypothetical protein HBA55_12535 [Pseudomaricurvus alkylphenolicus]|uniref:hypothetical protein n=1 Tax=Pseudomaricurvus alkylphenolicus TaxID=1306991 RepID=UPI00142359EC|nr:hypothetical protein [Pseudomaricurvus alkylphenolicus]NIB40419.1 hypothetical protein [Pseudomaricurvus alkylphenolicus]